MNTIADIQEKCKPYIVGEKIFNQYVLKDYLGQGGFGRVFLVENRAGSFALKVVQSNTSMDIRGMETVRDVSSMRLVKFLDYGKTVNGEDCFVMEYVENNMADILQEAKALDFDTACTYFAAIVESLIDLERFNIIHRDIKPSNLFLVEDVSGNALVKIGDFATAKFLDIKTVSQSQVMGTIHYMSPEHFKKGGGHGLDRWSAAVILYQMLTGKFVFDGEQPTEIIGAIIACQPDLSPVPKSFTSFFEKCFDIDPDNRHQSARQMLMHFKACRARQLEGDQHTNILTANEMKHHILAARMYHTGPESGAYSNQSTDGLSGATTKSVGSIFNNRRTTEPEISAAYENALPGAPTITPGRHYNNQWTTESDATEFAQDIHYRRGFFKPAAAIAGVLVFFTILGFVIYKLFFFTGEIPVPAPEIPEIRTYPVTTSESNVEQTLGTNRDRRPKTYFQNSFVDNPDATVTDEACGRVWKLVEDAEPISRQSAEVKITALNARNIDGHSDWRLPTISELFTLMAPEIQADHSYLKLPMGTARRKFWSADHADAGLAWFVDFKYGIADTNFPDSGYYVLAVRLNE